MVTRPGSGAPVKGFVPTGSTPDADAQQIATAFLTAWTTGNYAQAAGYTDDSAAAQATLAAYGKHLGLRRMTAAFQAATAVKASPAQRLGRGERPGGERERRRGDAARVHHVRGQRYRERDVCRQDPVRNLGLPLVHGRLSAG